MKIKIPHNPQTFFKLLDSLGAHDSQELLGHSGEANIGENGWASIGLFQIPPGAWEEVAINKNGRRFFIWGDCQYCAALDDGAPWVWENISTKPNEWSRSTIVENTEGLEKPTNFYRTDTREVGIEEFFREVGRVIPMPPDEPTPASKSPNYKLVCSIPTVKVFNNGAAEIGGCHLTAEQMEKLIYTHYATRVS